MYFNQSTQYVCIDGVFEKEHKSTLIRNISLKIVCCRDKKILNFAWSNFIFLENQRMRMINNFMQTTKAAYPFKIESDNIVCVFTKFCDLLNTFSRTFKLLTKKIFDGIRCIKNIHADYSEA
ncbi:hypothetical protein [Thomasclavelia spiroformis]|uniref:hypothetical protein n=1 Tax=Thomasclavelia spiroformis TaxID=29348 RepID=UPI0026760B59|nr:hypothetical protein [Thomasclavelia spiroformis]